MKRHAPFPELADLTAAERAVFEARRREAPATLRDSRAWQAGAINRIIAARREVSGG